MKQPNDIHIKSRNIHHALSGFGRCVVVDATSGAIVKDYGWQKNLILDTGLDMLGTTMLGDLTKYAHAGTDDSPALVSQTGLVAWAKHSTSYATGECGYSAELGTYHITRAYVFSAETSLQTYKEMAVSPFDTDDPNTFNRLVLTTPAVVNAGQQLKFYYTLDSAISINLASEYKDTDMVTGWTGSTGWLGLGFITAPSWLFAWAFSQVSSSGSTSGNYGAGMVLEPSDTGGKFKIGTSAITPVHVGEGVEVDNTIQPYIGGTWGPEGCTLSDYVPGSYTRSKTWKAGLNDCNSTSIYSLCVGASEYITGGGYHYSTPLYFQFENPPFTKDNNHTLSFTLNLSWSRTV